MKTQLFVEGIADEKFLNDFLTHLKLNEHGKKIFVHEMGGKDKLKDTLPSFKANIKIGIQNVLILDADDNFEARKIEITEFIETNNLKADFFLFPNNQSNGDLEILLENIINTDNQSIFECWNAYEQCLDNKNKNYTTPAKKTKIYAYLEALLKDSKKQKEMIKENKRDYLNASHWNLNVPYLNPLREFLEKYKS